MNYNINKSLLILGMLAVTLSSCFVGKRYERPTDPGVEKHFRNTNNDQDTLTIATLRWDELFTDTILANYVRKGLEKNLDIRLAIQQIAIAESYYKQGRAGNLPVLSTGVSLNNQILSRTGQFGALSPNRDLTQYQVSGGVSWEADIWGKIRSGKLASEAAYLQSIAAQRAVKTRLIATIATYYFQLLSFDKQREILEATIANRKSSYDATTALWESGQINGVGLKRTEAQIYNSQSIMINIKNQIRLLENTLSILIGEPAHAIDRSDLDAQTLPDSVMAGVPVQLLSNRPDIIAAEYNLINAYHLTNVAKSQFYPSLTITGTGGYQSLDFSRWLNATSLFSSAIGGLTQPILNGRRIRTQYEISKAKQEQALAVYRQSILDAGKEVSDALFSFYARKEDKAVKEKELEAYKTATSFSEELLNNGLINYLEVLTAKDNELATQLTLIDIQYGKMLTIIQLYQALGGGWR